MASNGYTEIDGPDHNVEMWKIKRLIKSLDEIRGNGTSMISLIIPARGQIARVSHMLEEEYGTATCIKSRVNRLSVMTAITSVRQKLKLYKAAPPNGLVIYCGEVITGEGKTRKVNVDFEPLRPINKSLYLCDNRFHTEALKDLMDDEAKYGFIVIDGKQTLYGTLCGNTREVLFKFKEDLPNKHGRGGQSALRFSRLREEKRHNYLRKAAEEASRQFIVGDHVTVAGLVLAGSADFKMSSAALNYLIWFRLQAKVIKIVDVSYGGDNGFNQAIELSVDSLAYVKFIKEKKLIGRYFDEISQDTGRFCFGVEDTLRALEMGAVDILIVWENLDITRYVLKSNQTEELIVRHLSPAEEKDLTHLINTDTGVELEIHEQAALLEWFAYNYKNFGATLEIVTDRSQEGAQFVKGFGGMGGILRYKVDFESLGSDLDITEQFNLDDYN